MKNFFLFAVLFTLVLGSCSSDDSSPPEPPKSIMKNMELVASNSNLVVGEKVSFTVYTDEGVITDAEIFANGVKIDYEHIFTVAGEYQVFAKKANFNDSKALTIIVRDVNQLQLSTSANTVNVNTQVTFQVFKDDDVITDAEIFSNGIKIGYSYTFVGEGEYHIIAKKAGYTDSNTLVIHVVKEQGPPGENSKFLGKWIPMTFKAHFLGSPVPGGNLDYPHKVGCDKDTIELLVGYIADFVLYDASCVSTTATESWSENGDVISMPIFGTTVEGKVKEITTSTLIIEVDVYRYRALVEQLYPEVASMIISGMKADVKLVK